MNRASEEIDPTSSDVDRIPRSSGVAAGQLPRTLALVGLMGAGKSYIGRLLAQHYAMSFVDADSEIETAAGRTISEIFAERGEAEFRAGERKVIARLLAGPPIVLATGGGAYLSEDTRSLLKACALTLWLRADLDVLVRRTAKRSHRPLLRTGDPRVILSGLMEARYPIYAQADLVVDSNDVPAEITLRAAVAAIDALLATA